MYEGRVYYVVEYFDTRAADKAYDALNGATLQVLSRGISWCAFIQSTDPISVCVREINFGRLSLTLGLMEQHHREVRHLGALMLAGPPVSLLIVTVKWITHTALLTTRYKRIHDSIVTIFLH